MLSSPKPCGRWSSRFCRPSLRSRRAGDRAPRIGRRWPASSWFCARACRGSTCRIPGWAAAARRVGAGWVDGRCLSCAPPGDAGAATGCGPARLVARCSRKRQVASENRGPSPGPNPTDRGQAGHEAPPRRERQGHAARPDAHGGNRHDSRMLVMLEYATGEFLASPSRTGLGISAPHTVVDRLPRRGLGGG